MIGRQPKWTLRVIHMPSGIEVIRASDHFRSQHYAKESAIRYLMITFIQENLENLGEK